MFAFRFWTMPVALSLIVNGVAWPEPLVWNWAATRPRVRYVAASPVPEFTLFSHACAVGVVLQVCAVAPPLPLPELRTVSV